MKDIEQFLRENVPETPDEGQFLIETNARMDSVEGIKKTVDGEYMARASAVFNASATASMPLGSLLVTIAVAQVSTAGILIGSAVLAGIMLLVTAFTKPELEKKEELANAA